MRLFRLRHGLAKSCATSKASHRRHHRRPLQASRTRRGDRQAGIRVSDCLARDGFPRRQRGLRTISPRVFRRAREGRAVAVVAQGVCRCGLPSRSGQQYQAGEGAKHWAALMRRPPRVLAVAEGARIAGAPPARQGRRHGFEKQYNRHRRGRHRDKRWPALRLAAKRRDGWQCVKCGAGGRLEVDHMKPCVRRRSWRSTLANLQTLCESCHSRKTESKSDSIRSIRDAPPGAISSRVGATKTEATNARKRKNLSVVSLKSGSRSPAWSARTTLTEDEKRSMETLDAEYRAE